MSDIVDGIRVVLAGIGACFVVMVITAVCQALLYRYRHSTPERYARRQARLRAKMEKLQNELDDGTEGEAMTSEDRLKKALKALERVVDRMDRLTDPGAGLARGQNAPAPSLDTNAGPGSGPHGKTG